MMDVAARIKDKLYFLSVSQNIGITNKQTKQKTVIFKLFRELNFRMQMFNYSHNVPSDSRQMNFLKERQPFFQFRTQFALSHIF